jgi:Uncharacterised nucleotidyltransferase
LDLLPPRISDPRLFALLVDILAVGREPQDSAKLRLRLIDQAMSWQALADLACAQGVLMPLIRALNTRSLLLPIPHAATDAPATDHPTVQLMAAYRQHSARRNRQIDQLFGVIEALNRHNIEPLLLKGARYLLAPRDSWGEARDMRDIDVLVRPDEAGPAVEALTKAGYATDPKRPIPIDHHLPEMGHAAHPSAVEIHIEALAFSGRAIVPTSTIWQHGVRPSGGDLGYIVLPSEWHLLHGLLHHQISDHGHARKLLAVKPLWEFAMLGGEVSREGWRTIADHLAARGQADVLASFIVQAERLYGVACPPGIVPSAAARNHAAATIARAGAPDWLRRARFVADQLRFGFARETLALRYKLDRKEVTLATAGRHLHFLTRHHQGRVLRRLFGPRGGP